MKAMKLIYIIIASIMVLGLVIMCKTTFLLAASNSLLPHARNMTNDTLYNKTEERTWYCTVYEEIVYGSSEVNETTPQPVIKEVTKCMAVPPSWNPVTTGNTNISTLTCLGDNKGTFQTSYSAKMYSAFSARWNWCLWLIIVTPEFFVFLRCFWRILFKIKRSPSARTLIIVSNYYVVWSRIEIVLDMKTIYIHDPLLL